MLTPSFARPLAAITLALASFATAAPAQAAIAEGSRPTPRPAVRTFARQTAPVTTPTVKTVAPGAGSGAFLHMTTPNYTDIAKASQVVLQQHQWRQIPAIRAAHPGVRIYMYSNAAAASEAAGTGAYQPSVVTWPQLMAHPAWMLRSSNGSPVRWSEYPYLQPIDLGNAEIAKLAATNLTTELKAHDWDGVMLDDVNVELAGHDWTGTPANYTGGSTFTATDRFLRSLAPALHTQGKQVAINMQSSWNNWKPQVQAWAPLVDVINLEHSSSWTESTAIKPAATFLGGLDAAWRIEEMTLVQSLGARVWAHDYGSATDVRAQAYNRALFLMSWDGRSESASMWTPSDWVSSYYHPASTMDLGAPTGATSRLTATLYRRTFTKGTLVLNTASTNATYTDPKGTVMIPALSSVVR